jgi:hypothetical protein
MDYKIIGEFMIIKYSNGEVDKVYKNAEEWFEEDEKEEKIEKPEENKKEEKSNEEQ